MRPTRTFAATAVLAATALLTSACGGSPTAAPVEEEAASEAAAPSGPTEAEALYEEVGALTGQERRDRLVELAAEEGGLDLYTSMTTDVADAVTEAFSDEFDIDVNLYRAGSETVLTAHPAGAGRGLRRQRRGRDQRHRDRRPGPSSCSPTTRRAPGQGARGRHSDGWTATRFNMFAPGWNTELVKGDIVPT